MEKKNVISAKEFRSALIDSPVGKLTFRGKTQEIKGDNTAALRSLAKKVNDADFGYYLENGTLPDNCTVKLSNAEMQVLAGGAIELTICGYGFRAGKGGDDSWIMWDNTKYYRTR